MGVDLLDEAGVTPREAEVLHCLASRPTNGEIADQLYISLRTVESHISSLLRKLQLAGRRELAALAVEISTRHRDQLAAPLAALIDPETFFGRDEELTALVEDWQRARGGGRVFRLVLGEAGIGKSRLVAELARIVHADAGEIWYGACFEERGVAFEPLLTVAKSVLTDRPESRQELSASQGAVLSGHLVSGGVSVAPSVDVVDDAAAVRTALANIVDHALVGPTLLVLEDVHWAEDSGWDAMLEFLQQASAGELVVVATSRDTAPELDEQLWRRLSRFLTLPGSARLDLTGLGPAAAARLLPGGGPDEISRAISVTGGNPLLLLSQDERYPNSLGALLHARFDRLSAADVDLVDLAAILGSEYSLATVAAGAGLPVIEVVEAMERAALAGIVRPLPGRPGTYSFHHALFRSARINMLSPRRVMELHSRAVHGLEAAAADPLAIARHACAAVPLVPAHRAAELALDAGRMIPVMHDPGMAADFYGEACAMLDLATEVEADRALELTIRLGAARCLLGDATGPTILTTAAHQARDLGRGDLMAEAVASMVTIPGGALHPGQPAPEFVALCESTLATLGPTPSDGRVRILGALGIQLLLGSDAVRGRSLLDQALTEAESLGDDQIIGRALLSRRYAGFQPDDVESVAAEAGRMVTLGHATGQPVLVDAGHLRASSTQVFRGDLRGAEATLDLVPPGGAPYTRSEKHFHRTLLLAIEGDMPGATEEAQSLQQAATIAGKYSIRTRAAPCAAILGGWRDGWHTLVDSALFLRSPEEAASDHSARGAAALALAADGQHSEVARMAGAFVADLPDLLQVPRPLAPTALASFSLAVAVAEISELARPLIGALEPYSGCIIGPAYPVVTADGVRADLLRVSGQPETAAAVAREAVTASRARGSILYLGYELVVLAEALRCSGAPSDEVKAAAGEAQSIATDIGAATITNLLRQRGLHQPSFG